MCSLTTRIDFSLINTNANDPRQPVRWGYMVRYFVRGWDYYTNPYRVEIDPPMHNADGSTSPFDLCAALAALEASGWTVRKWGASAGPTVGARAWRGPATPIRTRQQIIALRRRQSARLAASHGQVEPQYTTFIDYAYEG